MLMTCPDSSDRVPFRVRPFPCIVHDNLSGIIDFEHSHARVVRKLLSSGLPACWYAEVLTKLTFFAKSTLPVTIGAAFSSRSKSLMTAWSIRAHR